MRISCMDPPGGSEKELQLRLGQNRGAIEQGMVEGGTLFNHPPSSHSLVTPLYSTSFPPLQNIELYPMAPTTDPFCPACYRRFRTLTGFQSHLRQRPKGTLCHALYLKRMAVIHATFDSSSEGSDDLTDDGSESETDSDNTASNNKDNDNTPNYDNDYNSTSDSDSDTIPLKGDYIRKDHNQPIEDSHLTEDDDSVEENGPSEDDSDASASSSDAGIAAPEGVRFSRNNNNTVTMKSSNLSTVPRRRVKHVLVDSEDDSEVHVPARYTKRHRKRRRLNSRTSSIIDHSATHG